MRARRIAALLLLAVAAPACTLAHTSFNEPLRQADIDALVPGASTAREVVEQFGAPNEIVQLGYRSAYKYEHTVAKEATLYLIVFTATNQDNQADRVWMFFDEDDVLTHVGATLAADTAEYRMPWQARDDDEVP